MNLYRIAFCLCILAVASCKSTQTTTIQSSSKSSSATRKLTDAQQADVMYTFYNANKEKIIGNLTNSAALFAEVIRKDPSNAAAMYELAGIYLEQGKNSDALFYSRSAYQMDPKNEWYALQLSQALQKNGKFSESAQILDQLVKNYPDRADFYYELAAVSILANKPQEAIKAYDKLEEKIGITKDVSVQKQRIYQRMGKNDKAVAELQKYLLAFPEDAQAYGMLAELYQSMGDNQKALETYNKVKEIDPDNPFTHLSLANYYRNIGEKEKSLDELKMAFGNKNLDLETKISILSSYDALVDMHPEMLEQALDMCRIMIEAHPNDARVHIIYGDFLTRATQFEKAREEFRIAQKMGSNDFAVVQQLLFLHSQLNDWDAILSESGEALADYPDQPVIYYFRGVALSQKKRYEEAITSFQSGVKLVVDNNNLEAQFYAGLGDAYNELKDYVRSDSSYERALVSNPKDAFVMNNYSYYLSLRGDRLAKAEELSKRSNELVPNTSSFEDTYGWILYKMGKYGDAKTWIEKSLAHGSDKSAVVLEHFGDVLYKLGDTNRAIEYWQKAKDTGEPGSEFLEKKIHEKKLFE